MKNSSRLMALISAILFALSIPIFKIFLNNSLSPLYVGALAYFGAGCGMLIYNLVVTRKLKFENHITLKEIPYTIMMVISDIFAIILLTFGLKYSNSANASLLSNFEIVATSIIAYLLFKEKISKKLASSIILITIASIILTFEGLEAFYFQMGSFMVLLAYILWGFENNCTKILSSKNVNEITTIKTLSAGIGGILIAYLSKAPLPELKYIALILITGFLSYGLSVKLYIQAQKLLKASVVALYYAFSPYFAILFSLIILKEHPNLNFYIALFIMTIAVIEVYKSENDFN